MVDCRNQVNLAIMFRCALFFFLLFFLFFPIIFPPIGLASGKGKWCPEWLAKIGRLRVWGNCNELNLKYILVKPHINTSPKFLGWAKALQRDSIHLLWHPQREQMAVLGLIKAPVKISHVNWHWRRGDPEVGLTMISVQAIGRWYWVFPWLPHTTFCKELILL